MSLDSRLLLQWVGRKPSRWEQNKKNSRLGTHPQRRARLLILETPSRACGRISARQWTCPMDVWRSFPYLARHRRSVSSLGRIGLWSQHMGTGLLLVCQSCQECTVCTTTLMGTEQIWSGEWLGGLCFSSGVSDLDCQHIPTRMMQWSRALSIKFGTGHTRSWWDLSSRRQVSMDARNLTWII